MFKYTVFDGFKIVSQGNIEEVAIATKKYLKKEDSARILIFSDLSGKQMDLDLSGTDKDVTDRLSVYKTADTTSSGTGPGRPKMGVKPREVSLLPTHWEWLSTQSGGASATIRRLVDEKMKTAAPKDKIKKTQETVYTFLNSIAGDLENFEDAIRFLYRQDEAKFKEAIAAWPKDLKKHTLALASEAF